MLALELREVVKNSVDDSGGDVEYITRPFGQHIIDILNAADIESAAYLAADIAWSGDRFRPRIRRQERQPCADTPLCLHLEGMINRVTDRFVSGHRTLIRLIRTASVQSG